MGDVLRIVRAGKVRRVPLTDIQAIHAGLEPEGMTTPLDDLCATMQIAPNGDLITFRFEHINARDTFVMCMLLFAQSLTADDEDDDGEYGDDDEGVEAESGSGS